MKNLAILLALLLFTPFTYGQIDTLVVQKIIKEEIQANDFEGTILIADQGNIVYQQSSGHIDTQQKKAINTHTKFSIASVTKMITAIIVLQLVEEGKLQLNDPIEKLLPTLAIPNAKELTIHHLLLHISGLPNEQDALYLKATSPKAFVKETLNNSKHIGDLGQFNYANIDYVLLGLVIEAIEKSTWQEVVAHRIIDSLGLSNTGFLTKGHELDNFAYTFTFNEQGERIADPAFFIENFYAAGCMYSTAADLLKIDQAMYGEQLLQTSSKALLFTSYPKYNYTGYSVWTYNYPFIASQPKIMERRGGILGANVVLVRFLDTNKTLIILSNNNKFNSDTFGETTALKEALMLAIGSEEARNR